MHGLVGRCFSQLKHYGWAFGQESVIRRRQGQPIKLKHLNVFPRTLEITMKTIMIMINYNDHDNNNDHDAKGDNTQYRLWY